MLVDFPGIGDFDLRLAGGGHTDLPSKRTDRETTAERRNKGGEEATIR